MENNVIARTGRVQNWIDDPSSRLACQLHSFCCVKIVWRDPTELKPAGDTSVMVYDLELELQSISLRLEALALITGADSLRVARVHLEKSIAALTSSYDRGGVYKNGAVVLHLDLNHPDILEFVNMPRHEIPWAKRCVNLSPVMWDMAIPAVRDAILKGIARGDIWLSQDSP